MAHKVLCLVFAGDREVTQKLEEALKEAHFNVEVLPASTIDPHWAEVDLLIQFGLSQRPVAGEVYLECLRKALPEVPLMLVSGHYEHDLQRITEPLNAAYFQRDGKTEDFVALVSSILDAKTAR